MNATPRRLLDAFRFSIVLVTCGALSGDEPRAGDCGELRPSFESAAPDGLATDGLALVRRLKARFVEGATRDERVSFVRQQQRAIWAACDKILAGEVADETRHAALEEKLAALWKLVQLDEPGALDAAVRAAESLPVGAPRAMAQRAAFFPLWARWVAWKNTIDQKEAATRLDALVADVQRQLLLGNDDELLVGLAAEVPSRVQTFDPRRARAAAEQYADVLAKGDDGAQAAAKHLNALANRWALVGRPLAIEGRLVDGRQLDPSSLVGRVVLVEFWATWCQPCIAEFPKLRSLHDNYRKAGFEIVAVSVDEDRSQLEEFLRGKDLPWPVVCGHAAAEAGMRQPLARKCDVDTVPRSVLVDRRGNVAAVDLRGEPLSAAIKRLLEEPADKAGSSR